MADQEHMFKSLICNETNCCYYKSRDFYVSYSNGERQRILVEDGSMVYFNESCVQNLYHLLTMPNQKNHTINIILGLLYGLISLIGMVGNGLVIFVVLANKEMRTARNVYITNLAVANFLLALITVPFLYIPNPDINPAFPYNTFMCKLAQAFPSINIYCSTLTICIMAIDRYVTVKRRRMSTESSWMAIGLALTIWAVSFVLSLPSILFYFIQQEYEFGFRLTSTKRLTKFSKPSCQLPDISSISISIMVIQCCFLYVVPLVVLTLFTVLLTNFLKENQINTSRYRHHGSVPHNAGQYLLEGQSQRDSVVNSNRANTAARAATARRSRTTYLLMAMASSYAVLWLPFEVSSFLYDLQSLGAGFNVYNKNFDETSKVLAQLSICVNPFLYGFLNTNFNRHFHNIFLSIKTVMPCCKSDTAELTNRRFDGHYRDSLKPTGHELSVINTKSHVINKHMKTVYECDKNGDATDIDSEA